MDISKTLKDLPGGILLSIDEVIYNTNKGVVLEVPYHVFGLVGGGYIYTLNINITGDRLNHWLQYTSLKGE